MGMYIFISSSLCTYPYTPSNPHICSCFQIIKTPLDNRKNSFSLLS